MGRKPGTTGCKTCLKRRIKCDRGVPECFRCVRSGWKCDGYPPQVQFHAETFSVLEPGSSASPSSSPNTPPPSHSKSRPKSVAGQPLTASFTAFGPDLKSLEWIVSDERSTPFQQLQISADGRSRSQVQNVFSNPIPATRPALSPSEDSALKFSSEHLSPGIPMRLQLCFFGSYIRFIPSRIGHNKALDLAVSCLCQAHHMRLQSEPSTEAIVRGNRTYGVALQVLQKFINEPSMAFEPEILCAAELLATYEMIMNDDSTAYTRHIVGISKFIYSRGPLRYKTPFELSLLDSMRGAIIAIAMMTRTSCFLDEPDWRNIPCCHSGNVDEISVGRGKDCLMWLFSRLPDILRDLENYQVAAHTRWKRNGGNQDSVSSLATMRDTLLRRVLKQYYDLIDLEKYYEAVMATLPPEDRDITRGRATKEPFLVVEQDLPKQTLRFLEDHRASIQILIILAIRKLLDEPGKLQPSVGLRYTLSLECDRLRDNLLKSNLDDGTWEPQSQQHGPDFMRMGQNFTLRIAFAVVPKDDGKTREQICRKMEALFCKAWTVEEMDWLNKMTFGMCL